MPRVAPCLCALAHLADVLAINDETYEMDKGPTDSFLKYSITRNEGHQQFPTCQAHASSVTVEAKVIVQANKWALTVKQKPTQET